MATNTIDSDRREIDEDGTGYTAWYTILLIFKIIVVVQDKTELPFQEGKAT